MPKDPWYKFWPDKWENDTELQSCSLAAQGLLIKLMNIMHRSDKPGHLLINGEKPNKTSTKRIINCHQNEYKTRLKELIEKGVLVEVDGVVVCPKVVRDHTDREASREAGKRGGNPALMGDTLKGRVIPRCKKLDVRKKKEITTTEEKIVFSLPDWMPGKTWDLFLDHRENKVSKKSYPLFLTKFYNLKEKGWPPERVVDIIVEKGWKWFNPEWATNAGYRLEGKTAGSPPDTIAEERRARIAELEEDQRLHPELYESKEKSKAILDGLGVDLTEGRTTT